MPAPLSPQDAYEGGTDKKDIGCDKDRGWTLSSSVDGDRQVEGWGGLETKKEEGGRSQEGISDDPNFA